MSTYIYCAVLQSSDKKLLRSGAIPLITEEGEELLDCTTKPKPPSLDINPGPWYWHSITETWEITAP